MPTIPTYNAQRNINANIAAPTRNEAAQPFEDQQKILGVLQEITQKWSDAHDTMQYTEAKAKYEVQAAQIQARAAADPGVVKDEQGNMTFINNSKVYMQQLEDAKNNSIMNINNDQVSNRIKNELNYGNQVASIKIDQDFRSKHLAYNKVQIGTNLAALQQKKLNATTPAEVIQYDHWIMELIDKNLMSGTITPEEGDKLLKDAQKTGVQYQIYNDPSTQEKDSQVLKQLKDQSDPKYSYLDPKTRLDLIEESQRRIFQNNQTFKRENELSKNERFNNIFTKANEGTLRLADLDAEMKVPEDQGGIPKQQLLSIRNSLQTRIKTDLETITANNDKAADYLTFVDNFIDDETDRQKGREAIVTAFKDNILSPKEAAFLNSLKREAEEIGWSRDFKTNNLIPFKNAITGIGEWFRGKHNSTEKEAAIAIKKLLSGAADGQNIEEIVPKILNEDRVNTKPDIKTFPPGGQLMVDPVTGVKAMVYPDGKIEVIK